MSKKVFLGGSCDESTWRNQMIVHLQDEGMECSNPVVDDENYDTQTDELREQEGFDFCLYGITPKTTGMNYIARVVDDSNKRPEKTILVLMRKDGVQQFEESQWRSLCAVARIVRRNGGTVLDSFKHAAVYIASL